MEAGWSNYMFSSGILRLRPRSDRFYLFAFLKHPVFKAQLAAKVPRGATIRHAKSLWMDCHIPLPAHDETRTMRYVSALVRAIVGKEVALRRKAEEIRRIIDTELDLGSDRFSRSGYALPTRSSLTAVGRFDAAIYDRDYTSKIALVRNYRYGYTTPKKGGFTVTPGPSLEIKILKTRVNTAEPTPGYYALVLPTHISVYGTLNRLPYLGTGKNLPLLQWG